MGINQKISSVIKSLIGTAGVFVLGMIISFIFNWAITKYMPQKEVGFYQYYISIITLAMLIVPLGYQGLAQREAIALNKKSIIRLSQQAVVAILLGSIIFGSIWFFGVSRYKWVKDLIEFDGLLLAIVIIPIYASNIFFKAVLQGQNKIFSSILPDVLVRPTILLLSLIILPILGLKITYTNLLWVLMIILICTLIFLSLKAIKINDFETNETNETNEIKKSWFRQAIILLPIGLLSIINERIDVVMVTKILGPESNAIYGVAFKFALFSGFGLVILNQIMVPHYADYFKNGQNTAIIKKKIKPNVRISFFLSLLVFLLLLIFGENVLGWFGKPTEKYSLGFSTMIILAFGQLFNVAFGSTGYILTMAKKESLVILSIGTGMIANILLNYFLVPIIHLEGAAIATSVSIIVWNVMMLIFVKKKTKINPTIF